MSIKTLGESEFRNLDQYGFYSSYDNNKIISQYIHRLEVINSSVNSLNKEIEEKDVDGIKASLKSKADYYHNILPSRSNATMVFQSIIWVLFYLVLSIATSGCGSLLIMLLFPGGLKSLMSESEAPIIIALAVIYFFSIVAFIRYTKNITKHLNSDDDDSVIMWITIMCVPYINLVGIAAFICAAKSFYKALDYACYRCSQKERDYLKQIHEADYLIDDLEDKIDKLLDEKTDIIINLEEICCCPNCIYAVKLSKFEYCCTLCGDSDIHYGIGTCNVIKN